MTTSHNRHVLGSHAAHRVGTLRAGPGRRLRHRGKRSAYLAALEQLEERRLLSWGPYVYTGDYYDPDNNYVQAYAYILLLRCNMRRSW